MSNYEYVILDMQVLCSTPLTRMSNGNDLQVQCRTWLDNCL